MGKPGEGGHRSFMEKGGLEYILMLSWDPYESRKEKGTLQVTCSQHQMPSWTFLFTPEVSSVSQTLSKLRMLRRGEVASSGDRKVPTVWESRRQK